MDLVFSLIQTRARVGIALKTATLTLLPKMRRTINISVFYLLGVALSVAEVKVSKGGSGLFMGVDDVSTNRPSSVTPAVVISVGIVTRFIQ